MNVYWLEQAEGGAPLGDEWLSAGERGTLAGLRVPKRRADWRLGRWTAKRAVAARLGLDATTSALAEIEIAPAASGAPRVLYRGWPVGLAISISHSHGVGFCALADEGAALGCDVERVEARSPAFLFDYFTSAEQGIVARAERGRRDLVVTLLWSAKESALKALECGLREDIRAVSVLPGGAAEGAWHPLTALHTSGRAFAGWWRSADAFVWTIAALPRPSTPISLHSATPPVDGRALPHGAALTASERR